MQPRLFPALLFCLFCLPACKQKQTPENTSATTENTVKPDSGTVAQADGPCSEGMQKFEDGLAYVHMWDHLDSISPAPDSKKIVQRLYAIYQRKKKQVELNKSLVKDYNLPSECIVYEYVTLKNTPNRALAFWIEQPLICLNAFEDAVTSCPDELLGRGYIGGKFHFSLLDISAKKIINTIDFEKLVADPSMREECYLLPLAIASGLSYHSTREGLATIMYLQDLNHDGVVAEFPVYEYQACSVVTVCIVGFDPKSDRLQQFPFEVQVQSLKPGQQSAPADSIRQMTLYWLPNLPVQTLAKERAFTYNFYAGHGAETWESYQLELDSTRRIFKGMVTLRGVDDMDETLPFSPGEQKQ